MTREHIKELYTEAAAHGDMAQVAICQRALDGDPAAWAVCERVIRDAALAAAFDAEIAKVHELFDAATRAGDR